MSRVVYIGIIVFFVIVFSGCIDNKTDAPRLQQEDIQVVYVTAKPTPEPAKTSDVYERFKPYRIEVEKQVKKANEQAIRYQAFLDYNMKGTLSVSPSELQKIVYDLYHETITFTQYNSNAIASIDAYISVLNAEVDNLDYDWYSEEYDKLMIERNNLISANERAQQFYDNFRETITNA